jgi:large subunit ribosomal protein L16
MLTPSRTRYRKTQRRNMKGKAYHNCDVLYGNMGIITTEPKWITANQIESARIAISRVVKKYGKMWIRIFPDRPYTKKPAETRQGKGKGGVEGYVAVVRPGQVLFEVKCDGFPELEREALMRAWHKLPVGCKLIEKLDI